MPTIAGELRTSTEDATQVEDLAEFSCGDGRLAAERTVENIVAAYHSGRQQATLRVTREVPDGALVGVVAIEWKGAVLRNPLFPVDAYSDAAYIAVLTLSGQYRGGYTTQDGASLSHALLLDALQHIADVNDGSMPPVQAIIEAANAPSRALFESFGFTQPIVTSPDLLYIRPRALPIQEGSR
jgi:hypothetical protein